MAIPNEPLKKTFKKQAPKGYVYYRTADGKRRQKYFKGEYKSQEMWDDFLAWKIKQTGGTPATRAPALESLRKPGDSRTAATVYEVVASRLLEVKKRRCKGTKADQAEITLVKRSLRLLAGYENMLADDINGTHMKEVQNHLIDHTGNSRKTINAKMKVIATAFKAAHVNKLCTEETTSVITGWYELYRLKDNDTHVPGPKHVPAVDETLVHQTIQAAHPLLGTMITCHLRTGMRSANLCALRWEDIDQSMYQSEGVWLYNPVDHKMKYRGKELPIYFGPDAITALLDYEKVRPDQGHPYIFNPRAGSCYHRFANQQTPKRKATGVALRILKLLKRGPASTSRIQRIKKRFSNEITYLRRLGHDIERAFEPATRTKAIYKLQGRCKEAEERFAWAVANLQPGQIGRAPADGEAKTLRHVSAQTHAILKALKKGPQTSADLAKFARRHNRQMTQLRNMGFRIKRQVTDLVRGDSLFTYQGYTQPESEKKSWRSYYESTTKKGKNLHYSTDSYYQAAARLIKRAGLEHWFPHQLRHLHTTTVGHALGIEAAQAVVGHSSKMTTRGYMEKNKALARKSQKVFG